MYKILIVEDDPVIASSLARQLTRWNYEATYVQSLTMSCRNLKRHSRIWC